MTTGSRWARTALVTTTFALLTALAPAIGDATAQPAARCSRGVVALTFDDGPRPATTRPILKFLIKHHLPATFFMIGEQVAGHRRLLHRMHRHGFRVANHTFRHQDLTTLSAHQIRSTLRHTNRAIRRAGLRSPHLMRPPYGAIDDHARRVIRDLGMVPVLWTIDSRDWDGRSADEIVRSVLGQLHRGPNTVLLHDGVANSNQTRAALPRLIRGVRHHGYCFTALNRHGVPRT
ncbi:MAG TPA: polysaccharide deacetylase family protein [Nocardioidaceae bacterium]|nr:polysaccharide deacetylase family protein [Nocardioidaceae bacterium]